MPAPKFLKKEMVLAIHARQIEKFGGTLELRDEGLLDSSLAQHQAMFNQQLLHPTVPEQAAAYLYHLTMNHPFMDGNKRTAFAVIDTFLRVNGYRLTLTDDAAYDLVMQVAPGELDKAGIEKKLNDALE